MRTSRKLALGLALAATAAMAVVVPGLAGAADGGGSYGYGNPYGDGITNSAALSSAISLGKKATLKGNKLRLRANCTAATTCTYALQGISRGKPGTKKVRVNIAAGASKKVTLKVKHTALPVLTKAKNVNIHADAVVRDIAASAIKKLKLIHKK